MNENEVSEYNKGFLAAAEQLEKDGPEAVLDAADAIRAKKLPRFDDVTCSQCGEHFGPGESGFSHCEYHQGKARTNSTDSFALAAMKRRFNLT